MIAYLLSCHVTVSKKKSLRLVCFSTNRHDLFLHNLVRYSPIPIGVMGESDFQLKRIWLLKDSLSHIEVSKISSCTNPQPFFSDRSVPFCPATNHQLGPFCGETNINTYAVVVAVTVTGAGVTTVVTNAVTVTGVVRELIAVTTEVLNTVVVDVAGTSIAQEQTADRAAG